MDISNKTAFKIFGALGLFGVFFVYFQYENQPRGSGPYPLEKVAATPAPAPVAPPAIKPFMIYPFDMTMRRSDAFRIDGDLRPIWIVSGRIRNNSEVEVKSISIRIEVTHKAIDKLGNSTNGVVDATTLIINMDIPADSVGSFSRTVQLMPPAGSWDWNYDVIKAEPK